MAPKGKVFGIDPVPEMVEAARPATDHLGYGNAQFDVACADRLLFPPDTFDAVVSRFGVMFFPSPVDAVREMLRVLKFDTDAQGKMVVLHEGSNGFTCMPGNLQVVGEPPIVCRCGFDAVVR